MLDVAVSTSPRGHIQVVHVHTERLGVRRSIAFKKYLMEVAERDRPVLLVDLKNVQYMDSSGVGALVAGMKALGNRGEFALCNVQPKVQDLLRLTRMDRLFPTYSDVDEAVSAFS